MLETWYDLGCTNCFFHLSTDFNTGMARTKKEITDWAKASGWLIKNEKETYCPKCVAKLKERGIIA